MPETASRIPEPTVTPHSAFGAKVQCAAILEAGEAGPRVRRGSGAARSEECRRGATLARTGRRARQCVNSRFDREHSGHCFAGMLRNHRIQEGSRFDRTGDTALSGQHTVCMIIRLDHSDSWNAATALSAERDWQQPSSATKKSEGRPPFSLGDGIVSLTGARSQSRADSATLASNSGSVDDGRHDCSDGDRFVQSARALDGRSEKRDGAA